MTLKAVQAIVDKVEEKVATIDAKEVEEREAGQAKEIATKATSR